MPKRSYSSAFPATLSLGGTVGGGTSGGGMAYRGVRSKPKYRKAAKVSKSVKQYVKQAVMRDEEVKQALSNSAVIPFDYVSTMIGALSNTPNIFACIPRISAGVAQGERIGSEIRPKQLRIRGVVGLSGKVNQAWDIRLRVMVVQNRSILTQTNTVGFVSDVSTNLLMSTSGGGATVGYTGEIANHFLPINTDKYLVLHDQEFPLSAPAGTVSFQGPPLTAGTMASMPASAWKALDIKVKLPARLRYDDGNIPTALPTNSAPYLLMGWSNPSENAIFSSNGSQPVVCSYYSTLSYVDA